MHPVSIHALLAECDCFSVQDKRQDAGFNPRTPCGVRPVSRASENVISGFQSTHSLRSATINEGATLGQRKVSIHALLAECDRTGGSGHDSHVGFNPRTPCGVRQGLAACRLHRYSFNPRTPCGVRLPTTRRKLTSIWFQSTHSLRSATVAYSTVIYPSGVSIHALLAECDLKSSTGEQPG